MEIQEFKDTPIIVAAVVAGCLVVMSRAKWSASNGNRVFDGLKRDYQHTLQATEAEKLRRYKIGHQACTLSAVEIVSRSIPFSPGAATGQKYIGFDPEILDSFIAPDGSYNFWGLSTEYLYRILVVGADWCINEAIVQNMVADALIWPVFVPGTRS